MPYLETEVVSANFALIAQPSSLAEGTRILLLRNTDCPALRNLFLYEVPFLRLAIALLLMHEMLFVLEKRRNILLHSFQL